MSFSVALSCVVCAWKNLFNHEKKLKSYDKAHKFDFTCWYRLLLRYGMVNHEGGEKEKEKKGHTSLSVCHNKSHKVVVFLGNIYINVFFKEWNLE